MFVVFLQTRWTVCRSVGEDPPLHHPTAFSYPFQWKASTKFLSINYNNSNITNGVCFLLLSPFFPGETFPTIVQQHTIDPCSSLAGWDGVWKWLRRGTALSCSLSTGGLWRKSSLICSHSLDFCPLWESSCWSGSTHIYEEGQIQLAQTHLMDSAPYSLLLLNHIFPYCHTSRLCLWTIKSKDLYRYLGLDSPIWSVCHHLKEDSLWLYKLIPFFSC